MTFQDELCEMMWQLAPEEERRKLLDHAAILPRGKCRVCGEEKFLQLNDGERCYECVETQLIAAMLKPKNGA